MLGFAERVKVAVIRPPGANAERSLYSAEA
jgi:hypothetical protein